MNLLQKIRGSETYFKTLSDDLDTLRIRTTSFGDSQRIPKINNYYDLFGVIERVSRRIGLSQSYNRYEYDNEPAPKVEELKTEFAQYAFSLMGLPSRVYSSLGLCSRAEHRFIKSMESNEIANDRRFSPIIITRHDETVGILKQIGEMSYYAFENDSLSNTRRGHVYWTLIDKHNAFNSPLAAPHAWHMPIEDIDSRLKNGRISTFLIPAEERRTLKATCGEDRELFRQSHENLKTLAELALENSARIDWSEA